MRQSLLLSGDTLNSHFHLVKTYFEPAVDLIIAAEERKSDAVVWTKAPLAIKIPAS